MSDQPINNQSSSGVAKVTPIIFSEAASIKAKELITDEENEALKLRVYVTGGGCSGFQYGFTLMKSKPMMT